MSDDTQSRPTFVVAMRGPAGFTFARDEPLRVGVTLSGGERVDVTVHSIFADAGPEVAISREVWVDARGMADSLPIAIEAFTNLARGLLAMVSVVTNGPVANIQAELGYDATEGLSERDFFQQFIPKDSSRPTPARTVPVDACKVFINSLDASTEKERLERAIGQYHHALQHWEIGNETIALSHLWIAVEALTKAVLRDHLAKEGISQTELLDRWGIELKQLDAEVRSRLIFQGDTTTYRDAKKASDAYEHSFESMDAVRARASGTRERTATYVRESIFRLMDLPSELFATLTTAPFDKPYFMGSVAYVRGKLLSESGRLVAEGEAYPRLKWSHRSTMTGDPKEPIRYHETVSPVIAQAAKFKPTNMELWGGPPEGRTRSMAATYIDRSQAETESSEQDRAGCIGWLARIGRRFM